MNLNRTYIPDIRITIALEESDRFDIEYTAPSVQSGKENGVPLNVWALRADVDMLTGEVTVKAGGYLRNANGHVGERDREQFLEPDQVPTEAKHIVAEEARRVREQIAAIKGVTFQ